MKKAYPITIKKEKDFFVVFIPDFNLNTQGDTIADTIGMARDAIGMAGCYRQDEGKAIPEASNPKDIEADAKEIITLVDIDFDDYRREHKNITI